MPLQNVANPPLVEKWLYRPREAAQVTGTSTSWIYARIADGTLKSVRLAGRVVRIRREDLVALIGNRDT